MEFICLKNKVEKAVYGKLKRSKFIIQTVSKKHRLSTKLLISILLWVFCAVIFTGSTLVFLWQLENGGIAINKAGSLRMRIYQLSMLVEQKSNPMILQQKEVQFSSILSELKISKKNQFFFVENKQIHEQIQLIEQNWESFVLPMLNHYSKNQQKITKMDFEFIENFVIEINELVKLIEMQNTNHIAWLRFFQAVLILMILFSAFSGIYLLYHLVIKPLIRIQEGIFCLSEGNLSNRIEIKTNDEFGAVSIGFNKMAENLADLYANLEEKVNEKTAALKEKNHELSALYDITAFLHESHTTESITQGFLANIIKLSNANAGSIRLVDKGLFRLNYICSQNVPDSLLNSSKCISLENCLCGKTIHQSKTLFKSINKINTIELLPCVNTDFTSFLTFQIQHNQNKIGIMTLYFKHKQAKISMQKQHLIKTLVRQLAVAIENQQLVLSEKQLAVMEERNLIAQGLHDSIAQSLSFLNLQIQMLQRAFKNNETDRIEKNLSFIQQGIQGSYDDVRELLLNFRTRIHDKSFFEIIENLIERFKQQTKVNVIFESIGNGPSLNPQQQLQATFILQEVLSNIRKHANCCEVKIQIKNEDEFVMTILDNGKGFEMNEIKNKKIQNVGISIMKERAQQIFSKINIESILNEGTKVELIIPKNQRISL